MALTAEQKRVASQIIKVGKRKGATHKELISALETAITEANLTNPNYGDADSVGWRQERSHYGSVKKRMNVKGAARRYFKETAAAGRGKGQTAGELAQSVQRSAYPDRYDEHKDEAKAILQALQGRTGSLRQPSSPQRKLVQPAQSFEQERAQAKLAFIQDEDKTLEDYIGIRETLTSLKDQPAKYKTVKQPPRLAKAGAGSTRKGGGKELRGNASRQIVQLGKMAQHMGLSVGEHPKFGGVAPVHVDNSYHYSRRAIDVSGDAELMRKFAKKVDRRYGKKLTELYWNGAGARNRKNGQRVGKGFVSGHTDHVHVAI